MQRVACELRKKREKWRGQLEALQRGGQTQGLRARPTIAGGLLLCFLFFNIFQYILLFYFESKNKIVCYRVGPWVLFYLFVSLTVQEVRLTSLKFGSQTNVIIVESTSEPNSRLTIVFVLVVADSRNYEQIDKRHTNLTWFTNNVLATSIGRRER